MAISFVETVTSTGFGATLGSAPPAGSLLIATNANQSSLATVASGWTQLTGLNWNIWDCTIAYKICGSGETAAQTPFAGTSGAISITRFDSSGSFPTNPIDSFYLMQGAAGTPPSQTSATLTPSTSSNAVFLHCYQSSNSNTAPTSVSGMTRSAAMTSGTTGTGAVFYQTGIAASSFSKTATWTGSTSATPYVFLCVLRDTTENTQTLFLRSTASSVVSSNAAVDQLSTTQGSSNNTGTSVRRAKNTGTFQFVPDTANNTTTLSPGTTPNSKGWIFDAQSGEQYEAGTWTLVVEATDSSNSGTITIEASLWKVTATTSAVTSVTQLANQVQCIPTAVAPLATAQTRYILDLEAPAVTCGAGEYIYLELYQVANTASSSTTATLTLDLDDTTATASRLYTPPIQTNTHATVTGSDTLGSLTESFLRGLGIHQAETVSAPSDTATRPAYARARTLADTIGSLTEQVNNGFRRAVSDTLGAVSDSIATAFHLLRPVSDTLGGITESTKRGLGRIVADSLGSVTESAARQGAFLRSMSDTLGSVTESLGTGFALHRASSDTLAALSEAIVRGSQNHRTGSDTISAISDAAGSLVQSLRSISDTMASISDAASSGGIALVRTAADTIAAISESVVATLSLHRSPADTLASISDSVGAIKLVLASAIDSIGGISDTPVRTAQSLLRSIADTLAAITDSATKSAPNIRTATDTLASVSDSVSRIAAVNRLLSDTMDAMSDSAQRSLLAIARSATDTLSDVTETLMRSAQAFVRPAVESVDPLSDSAVRSNAVSRLLSESLSGLSESATRSLGLGIRTASDTLSGVTDAAVREAQTILRALSETIAAVGETIETGGRLSNFVNAEDALDAIIETTRLSFGTVYRTAADTIAALSDTPQVLRALLAFPVEILGGLADVAVPNLALHASAVDFLDLMSDTARQLGRRLAAATDGLAAISDALVLGLRSRRIIAESLAPITDHAARLIAQAVRAADTLPALSDIIGRAKHVLGLAEEAIDAMTDAAILRPGSRPRKVSEALAQPSEHLLLGIGLRISSTLGAVSESLGILRHSPRTGTDTLEALSESLAWNRGALRGAIDTLAAPTETVMRTLQLFRPLMDRFFNVIDIASAPPQVVASGETLDLTDMPELSLSITFDADSYEKGESVLFAGDKGVTITMPTNNPSVDISTWQCQLVVGAPDGSPPVYYDAQPLEDGTGATYLTNGDEFPVGGSYNVELHAKNGLVSSLHRRVVVYVNDAYPDQ